MNVSWLEQAVEEVKEEVVALRRDFHMHPELGTQEVRTSAIVEKYLNDLGIETVRMFNTGVVGCLDGAKPGKCLLLRADMDALPMQEENDVPYCSKTPGVMHACGHDGHTAMLLCAANIIQSVQMLQTRELAPMDSMSLVIGKINGGTKGNIVAGTVEMQGNMRYMFDGSDESERCPRVRFSRMVENIAAAHRVKAEIKYQVEDYVVDNDPEMVSFVKTNVAPALVSDDKIIEYRVMASEDFSEFMSHNGIPGVFMFVGVGDHEKGSDNPHHSVNFNIDEDMLPVGVKAFVKMAMEYLK